MAMTSTPDDLTEGCDLATISRPPLPASCGSAQAQAATAAYRSSSQRRPLDPRGASSLPPRHKDAEHQDAEKTASIHREHIGGRASGHLRTLARTQRRRGSR